ncbi:MAG: hypothetical protein OEZ24_05515 [Candidatus Bathyarchaeota archaeon]|jgi:hypothetical protein|nr:hypothetical protein [Candidatus Bathyarchaeota archaeon]
MSKKPAKCEDGGCEFAPTIDSRRLVYERSTEEIRYARLWAEIESPRPLAVRETEKEVDVSEQASNV